MGRSLLLVLATTLTACSQLPAPPVTRVTVTPAFVGPASSDAVDAQWWRRFQDPVLDQWVAAAIAQNPDIHMAQQRWQAAKAGVQASSSRLLPTVALNGSQSSSHSALPDTVKKGMPDTNAQRISVNADWQLDVFGANRAAATATLRDAQAAEWGVAGSQLLVVSNVVRQYVLWQVTAERLRLLQAVIASQRTTESLIARRQAEGLASDFDQSLLQAERTQNEAQIGSLQAALSVAGYRLAVLSGQNPSATVLNLTPRPPSAWPQVQQLPVGQPADLLRRRPDLRAAEAHLAATSAQLASAQAERYPQLFASAVWGEQKLTLNGLALAASSYRNVALAFSQPLLNRGRINANIKASSAREQEALSQYDSNILTALEQVESTLAAQRGELARAEQLQASLMARQRSRQHAESLYREGQTGLMPLLELQRGVLAAELAVVDSRQQQLFNMVQLYQTLGGGWESFSPDLAQRAQQSTAPAVVNLFPVVSAPQGGQP